MFVNNIVHGGGGGSVRTNNIYTDLQWSQEARYGWYLGAGEVVEEDISKGIPGQLW